MQTWSSQRYSLEAMRGSARKASAREAVMASDAPDILRTQVLFGWPQAYDRAVYSGRLSKGTWTIS